MRTSHCVLVALFFGSVSLGCTSLVSRDRAGVAGPVGNPLLLRQLQVLPPVGGQRIVLLRLSRPVEQIRHSALTRPVRLVLEFAAPNAGDDLAERKMPQDGAELKAVLIARKDGVLKVTLELTGEQPPYYVVREMADWILVQIGPGAPSI